MVSLRFGGKTGTIIELQNSNEFIVVRTQRRTPLERTTLTARGRSVVVGLETAARFITAGVEILHTPQRDAETARSILKQEEDLQFSGWALADPETGAPVAYTENIFIKFRDDLSSAAQNNLLSRLKYGMVVDRHLDFARNSYFLKAPENIGQTVFDIALEFLDGDEVEFCHPETIRRRSFKAAFEQQWHLKTTVIGGRPVDAHAAVEAAWAHSKGQGTIIAVIDDGVDIDHPEFTGVDKIVAPRDVTRKVMDPRPFYADDRHGTACAGMAAALGVLGASGVAPEARLMPIRLSSGLGSIDEAEAFYWAAQRGADVISCSWGPQDGEWWDPNDPIHRAKVPLPDSTRLAIDAAVDGGRAGRGCVVTFAAGNGNESVDNDGYASYAKVIAVAACNDRSTRSAYSDFGKGPSKRQLHAVRP
jgi:subtilisin family serine protease